MWAQTVPEVGSVRATVNAEEGTLKRGCTHLYLLISLRLALCQAYFASSRKLTIEIQYMRPECTPDQVSVADTIRGGRDNHLANPGVDFRCQRIWPPGQVRFPKLTIILGPTGVTANSRNVFKSSRRMVAFLLPFFGVRHRSIDAQRRCGSGVTLRPAYLILVTPSTTPLLSPLSCLQWLRPFNPS